jgi:hypothetical protein
MLNLKNYPKFEEKYFVIDGANVCWHQTNSRHQPKIDNLKLLLNQLKRLGVTKERMKTFCDATLKHKIDNQQSYYSLLRKRIIQETPAGVKADEFILAYCMKHGNTLIISNDLFRKYYDQFPNELWIIRKRVTFLRVKNEILFIPMLESCNIKININEGI